MPVKPSITVNGWTIFTHPLFLAEIEALAEQVQKSKEKDPENYLTKNASKRLAAIAKLAFDVIPRDPTLALYRQGATLGETHRHWFRAKFFQQYRLFFRFDSTAKIIVYSWVNDDKRRRAYGSKSDAYRVFEKMLLNGHPPNDWDQLLAEAGSDLRQLSELLSNLTP